MPRFSSSFDVHPQARQPQVPSGLQERAMSMQCAACPQVPDPCPPSCGKGYMCQLVIPPSCAQCPSNECVIDPHAQHHGPSAGSIGGGLGGVLAAFALAAVLFWFWRKRHRRAKEALRRARADAKVRIASTEKFRPGGMAAIGGGDSKSRISSGNKGDGATVRRDSDTAETASRGVTSQANDDQEEELDEEDVEWTELREDGLTAFRKKPGQTDDIESDMAAFKRRSVGAATHLSRITEGAEDDDDGTEDENKYRRSRYGRGDTILEESPEISNGTQGPRGHSSSASIGSEQNRTYSRRSNAGRELSNPFADWSEIGSFISGASVGAAGSIDGNSAVCSSALDHRWSAQPATLETPSRVHRPVGAPLVDLHGKPKSPGYSGIAPVRSPSSPTRTVLPPVSPQSAFGNPSPAPSRPARMPELNLRLEDGSEPGKIGDDLIKKRSLIAASNDSRLDQMLSPAAPSTPSTLHFDKNRRSTLDLESSEMEDYPTQLANSEAYSRFGAKSERRLSTGTTGTTDTTGTLEYVMSAPQIVTPFAAEGAKRMQLKQGKALLVRSLSAIRREQEERRAQGLADQQYDDGSVVDDALAAHPDNPFGDSAAGSASSTFGRDAEGTLSKPQDAVLPMYVQKATKAGGKPIMLGAGHLASAGRPASSMSSVSLPFVDQPIREPLDRSPTDAHPRESIATLNLHPHRASSNTSHRGSNASLAIPFGQTDDPMRKSMASIGGLSVFDEIPFHIGQESSASEPPAHVGIDMPGDAKTSGEEAKSRESLPHPETPVTISFGPEAVGTRAAQKASLERSLSRDMIVDVDGDDQDEDAQPDASPFHDRNTTDDAIAADTPDHQVLISSPRDFRRTSVPMSLNGDPDDAASLAEEMDDGAGAAEDGVHGESAQHQLRVRASNPDFDQIRLRHELDSYPFANDS